MFHGIISLNSLLLLLLVNFVSGFSLELMCIRIQIIILRFDVSEKCQAKQQNFYRVETSAKHLSFNDLNPVCILYCKYQVKPH